MSKSDSEYLVLPVALLFPVFLMSTHLRLNPELFRLEQSRVAVNSSVAKADDEMSLFYVDVASLFQIAPE